MELLFEPVLQVYDVAEPEALSTALFPEQRLEGPIILKVGSGKIVAVMVRWLMQPLSPVPATVKPVLTVSVTLKVLELEPLLQV